MVSEVLSSNCWRTRLLFRSRNLNVTDLLLKNPETKDVFVVIFQQKNRISGQFDDMTMSESLTRFLAGLNSNYF